MRLRSQPKTVSILAVMIVCLTVMGAIACQFHPTSSEHEQEVPIGHHQDQHSDNMSCLIAALPENPALIELTFVSWAVIPVQLHADSFVSPPFIPPRYPA